MALAKEEDKGISFAVPTGQLIDGSVNTQIFGFGLFDHLPAVMPEATIFLHDDDGMDPQYKPGENVFVVNQYKDVTSDYTFCIYPDDYSTGTPQVLVILSMDDVITPRKSWWPLFFQRGNNLADRLARAVAIIVPHLTLRQAITDHFGISTTKIHIVGHGLPFANLLITPADTVTRRITKEVFGNEHSYFLAPASGYPSDNLVRLFAAYDLFRQRCKEPVRLLVEQPELGKHPKSVKKAWKQAQQKQDIVFLPALSQAERRKVVSSARAILHPSLSTAFPLPVLDAWTAEVPVLGTDNKVMQGAGALVQATDVKSIAEGMVTLVTTPFLASGLVENGKRRRQDFSWEAVAQRVAKVLREV